MNMLEVKDLNVAYGSVKVVSGVSFGLHEGEWLMIAGPNGAGKSTVIKAVSGELPFEGSVNCLGKDLKAYKSRELASNIGVLSQNLYCDYSFTVREVVSLGRYSHRKGLFGGDKDSEKAVAEALEMTGLSALSEKPITAISGGELQRVFLAQLFAQDPKILLLDEPTSHLDPVHVERLLELTKQWLEKPGRSAVTVIHDLSLAGMYADNVMLLSNGRICAYGAPKEALTKENLMKAYGTDVQGWMKKMYGFWKD